MTKERPKKHQTGRRASDELTRRGDEELLPLPARQKGQGIPQKEQGVTAQGTAQKSTTVAAVKKAAGQAAGLLSGYAAWVERKNREVAEAEARMRAAGPAQGARGPPLPPRPTPAQGQQARPQEPPFDPIAMVFGGGPPQQQEPPAGQMPRQGKQGKRKGQQPQPQERQPDPMEEMDRAMRGVFG